MSSTAPGDNFAPFERFYLGTYTNAGGLGIGAGQIDAVTGRPSIESWTSEVSDPSWLELASDGKTLYAVSELAPDGLINALQVKDGERLVLLSSEPTGAKPAHILVHPGGHFLITSMYDSGTIAVHPIGDDGSVGPACDTTQLSVTEKPGNAHQVVLDPSGEYLVAVDLGVDSVISYRLDLDSGQLSEVGRTSFASGSGPRHLVFHPNGSNAYLLNELDSTVTVCTWDAGSLTAGQVLATVRPKELPDAPIGVSPAVLQPVAAENYPGEILLSADARFVYLSNRGDNSVAIFAVRDDGSALELLATPGCGGVWPRHLALDRTGRWLYAMNERSGDLTWFPIDAGTGLIGSAAGRIPVVGVTQLLFVR